MRTRSFWFSVFHPDLPGPLIVIILFLFLSAAGNVFRFYDAVTSGQNIYEILGTGLAILLYAVPALGLLRMKRWARLAEIGFSFILVALGLVILLAADVLAGLFIIVTHGLVAAYLLSKRCRAAFGIQ